MLAPMRFRFLNEVHAVRDAADWNDATLGKLWLYNLHYFDDLSATDASERVQWHSTLIERWIAENPPTAGNGWEPYPTSLRIVNWIRWASAGHPLPPHFEDSLAQQVRWLAQRVEHHLMANHLFVNAKALTMAGVWFAGPEADAWRADGVRLIQRELPLQILSDGAHFERSPMYHALFAEDVLDLVNLARSYPGVIPADDLETWSGAARRMLDWLTVLTHPDGQIAFFNDAAFGIAPGASALLAYAARLGLDATPQAIRLAGSGYHRVDRGGAVLLLDAAPVGPDEQPGHAHADTLSFELSIDRQRVFVNGGTSTYTSGPLRDFERSTAAHNTVEIEGQDSSEVWGGFRVARRARILDVLVDESLTRSRIVASHSGYMRLPGRPIHEREWIMTDHTLRVIDRVRSRRTVHAVGRFLLHPAVSVTATGGLRLAHGRECQWRVQGGIAALRAAHWAPEFGLRLDTTCIDVTLHERDTEFIVEW